MSKNNVGNRSEDVDDPDLLKKYISSDESWVYRYDIETKTQSSQWKRLEKPTPKKARQGRTVNKEYYLEVMRRLREAIRQKRTEL